MKKYFIFILLIGILLLGVNFVSANEIDNINLTSDDSSDLEVSNFDNSNELQSSKSEEIIVNNWDYNYALTAIELICVPLLRRAIIFV